MDGYRFIIAAVLLATLAAVSSWLQGRYDSSDHRKATRIVREYKVQEKGPNIEDIVLGLHPRTGSHAISWSSEIMSSCLGHVRVTAYIPAEGTSPAVSYSFDVNLSSTSIHPTDPVTIEILNSLTASTATTSVSRLGPQAEPDALELVHAE